MEIKQAILELTEEEYAEMVDWFYSLEEEEWDRQIEEDATSGKLDFFKVQVEESIRNGTLGYL
jgi:hypothetical protein